MYTHKPSLGVQTHIRSHAHSGRRKSVNTDRCLLSALQATSQPWITIQTAKKQRTPITTRTHTHTHTVIFRLEGRVLLALVSNKVPSKVPPLMRSSRLSGASSQVAFIDFFRFLFKKNLPLPSPDSLFFLLFSSSAFSLSLSLSLIHTHTLSPCLYLYLARSLSHHGYRSLQQKQSV